MHGKRKMEGRGRWKKEAEAFVAGLDCLPQSIKNFVRGLQWYCNPWDHVLQHILHGAGVGPTIHSTKKQECNSHNHLSL